MLSNFLKWFEKSEENKPGDIAKRRLQLVLVNNRAGLDPELMERIKNDVVRVLSIYRTGYGHHQFQLGKFGGVGGVGIQYRG